MKNPTQFERLKDATQNHLVNKRFAYRAGKAKMVREDNKLKPKKDDNGNIIYTGDFHPETADKTILLSLAFNMALKNYSKIRSSEEVKEIGDFKDVSEMLIRFFSNKYINIIEGTPQSSLVDDKQDYKFQAIHEFRQLEYTLFGTVERFRNYYSHYVHEPGILSFTDLFENETKTLTQQEFDIAKAWFQKRFDDAHEHLHKSMADRKRKIEEELKKPIDQNISHDKKEEIRKQYNKNLKEINSVLAMLNLTLLDDNKNVTIDGQLFIASMFLFKRQAKVILDKWRGIKEVEGYQNTKHTFFTYYCMKESYSLANYDDNLLKFRNIASKLSTIPYSDNPQLRFIYENIIRDNEKIYDDLNKLPKDIKTNIRQLSYKLESKKFNNNEDENSISEKLNYFNRKQILKDKLNAQLIPVRKRNIYTKILLQYILDNDLINNENLSIAIAKTFSDRVEYFEKYKYLNIKENLNVLKNQLKNESDPEKKYILREHLKELKRNFIFKNISEIKKLEKTREKIEKNGDKTLIEPIGFQFAIKKRNALFQLKYNNDFYNITIPPELLMKWVVIHLETGSNIYTDLERYFIFHINNSKYGQSIEEIKNQHKLKFPEVPLSKILPRSIRGYKKEPDSNFLKDKTYEYIKDSIKRLNDFKNENKLQAKPWTFASKRKIDTILHYLHFMLKYDVYINKIDLKGETEIDYIRHRMFNMNTYNTAREYFRYFGRYENNTIHELDKPKEKLVLPEKVNKLKDEYSHLFKYIEEEIKNSNSLEDLFQLVINKQHTKLVKIKKKFEKYDVNDLIKLFKINEISVPAEIDKLLKDGHYARSFAVSPDIISMKEKLNLKWEEFKLEKIEQLKQRGIAESNFCYSEYAFVRELLWEKDKPATNIDFIFKNIIDLKTKYENKVKLKSTVYKLLLELKTQELVLWNIAKSYWKKEDGNEYSISELIGNTNSKFFQEFCTFNKVYRKELDYKFVIDDKFWEHEINRQKFNKLYELLPNDEKNAATKKVLTFTIKVPASKYDNKFLGVEKDLIKEYVLWNLFQETTKEIKLPDSFKHKDFKVPLNLNEYEDMMKMVNKELKSSIENTFYLLRAEKRIVEKSREKYFKILEKKYEDVDPLKTFHLTITRKAGEKDIDLYNEFVDLVNSLNSDTLSTEEKETIKDYLVNFRNYSLHYQLQDPERKVAVKKFLEWLNNSKNYEIENEYFTNVEKPKK